jgi:hypothetical protein
MNELFARFDTIERLLAIVLSKPEYRPQIVQKKSDAHNGLATPMNKLFPSDPE